MAQRVLDNVTVMVPEEFAVSSSRSADRTCERRLQGDGTKREN